MEIKIPFLKSEIGAGDVVKSATSALGIKPCAPCEERRRKFNDAIRLMPRENQWGKPPEVPEGWNREASFENGGKVIQRFRHTSGKVTIWHVIDGQYRNSHTFCCGDRMHDLVAQKWEELCRLP
jgi:hypothetical protein